MATFLIGFLAALVGSFAGGGTSLIFLPLLMMLNPTSYLYSLATTKFAASSTSFMAGLIHLKKNTFSKKLLFILMIPALIGTGIGNYFLQYELNDEAVTIMLGIVLLATAFYLGFIKKNLGLTEQKERELGRREIIVLIIFGTLVNIMNGLFGGTGIFVTIFLIIYMRFSFIKAIGYMLISYAPVNLIHAVYLGILTDISALDITLASLGALLGGYSGTKLQYLKGNKWVKTVSIIMMLALGLNLLLR